MWIFAVLVALLPPFLHSEIVLPAQPSQVHLAYGDSDRSLKVMWTTFAPTADSTLRLCPSGEPCQDYSGSMRLFLFDEEDGEDPIPRYIHEVTLENLKAGFEYTYAVGSGIETIWSQEFSFKGPKVSYTSAVLTNSTNFLAFGDFGTCSNMSTATLTALTAEAHEHDYDFYILPGDIAYDLYMFNGVRGDWFLRDIEGFAAFLPFMVVAGNHEYYYNFTHYKNLFDMPQDNDNFYYSYNVGPVHVIVFTTEALCSSPYCPILQQRQLEWMQADLQAANQRRHLQPWILAFSHKPLYCSVDWNKQALYDDCVLEAIERRVIYEDMFAYYMVDIHFAGHTHNYERHAPVYQEKTAPSEVETPHLYVNPSAPIHIVTGAAGSCRPEDDDMDPVSSTPTPYSVYRSAELSYSRVQANTTVLKVQQVASVSGEILDYFYIVKT